MPTALATAFDALAENDEAQSTLAAAIAFGALSPTLTGLSIRVLAACTPRFCVCVPDEEGCPECCPGDWGCDYHGPLTDWEYEAHLEDVAARDAFAGFLTAAANAAGEPVPNIDTINI